MTLILYAGYESCENAERVFGELLEMGVPTEDLSLVCAFKAPVPHSVEQALQMVDSGQIHLDEVRVGLGRVEAEGLEGLESAVGAGIATSSFDDDVSAVEEMADASDVAEDMAEPLQDRWFGMDDLEDAEKFAQFGTIDATRPTGPSFASSGGGDKAAEIDFTARIVDESLVLGDGDLATEMLAYALPNPKWTARQVLLASLRRTGVSASEELKLVQLFEAGGAILSITETPGKVTIAKIEEFVESSGGVHMRTFLQKSA